MWEGLGNGTSLRTLNPTALTLAAAAEGVGLQENTEPI